MDVSVGCILIFPIKTRGNTFLFNQSNQQPPYWTKYCNNSLLWWHFSCQPEVMSSSFCVSMSERLNWANWISREGLRGIVHGLWTMIYHSFHLHLIHITHASCEVIHGQMAGCILTASGCWVRFYKPTHKAYCPTYCTWIKLRLWLTATHTFSIIPGVCLQDGWLHL